MSAPEAPETREALLASLPAGERILWQGAPTMWGASMRIFHLPYVAAWLALVAITVAALAQGGIGAALSDAAPTLVLGTLALGLLALFGWLVRRTTTYLITDRRVVMQVGIALPMTLNLPYGQIEEAGLHAFSDGTGDLPLRLKRGERIAYLHLWPHARPWHLTEPQPMLRSVPDAQAVASLLARALAAHAGQAPAEVQIVTKRPRAAEAPGGVVATGAH